MADKRRDLTGQRFGRLVAIEDAGYADVGGGVWKCQCDCGNKTYVAVNSLTTGKTRSCGCLSEVEIKMTLPTDSAERKEYPMFRGLLCYFPAALAGVARHSKEGNDKHNPGQEMHHARGKSSDHGDCILRHLTDIADLLAALERNEMTGSVVERYCVENRVLDEANALAWRALALSQELHERLLPSVPLAPAAKE